MCYSFSFTLDSTQNSNSSYLFECDLPVAFLDTETTKLSSMQYTVEKMYWWLNQKPNLGAGFYLKPFGFNYISRIESTIKKIDSFALWFYDSLWKSAVMLKKIQQWTTENSHIWDDH